MSEPDDPILRDILDRASELPPQQRRAFLDEACSGNAELRAEIESLLASLEGAEAFLRDPTVPPDQVQSTTVESPRIPYERPGSRIGRYRLLEQIGEGGFGVVFMAEQREPVRRMVALKIIKLGMDTKQVIARFEAERQALAMMDHPNIAKVLDGGATEIGRPYFVMELVRGVSITEYCDKHLLSTRDRLELLIQVAHAVQHAHQKGIIHRDLKPSNVLVTVVDGKPVPKVIDFGVAKATNARLTEKTLFTEFRQLVGTPEYMSPEQAESDGTDIDTRSDIYSLGVLLYELLTGTTPFRRRDLCAAGYAEIQRIICEVEPPSPSDRLSTLGQSLTSVAEKRHTEPRRLSQLVRGELDWIAMKCLEKDRSRRYDSASEFAKDILRYLHDETVVARPSGTLYRLKKFARRHKVQVTAILSVWMALVAGLIIAEIGMVKATHSAKREHLAHEEAAAALNVAQHERDQAQAVNAFLGNMFSFISLEKSNSTSVSVRHVLDLAAQDLDHGILRNHEEVEAGVRTKLSDMYLSASMYPEALSQANKAVQSLRPLYPQGNVALGRSLVARGRAMLVIGEPGAEPVLAEALAMQRQHSASDSIDLANALHAMAQAYLDEFDDQEAGASVARPLLGEAMQIRQHIADRPGEASELSALATADAIEGNFAKSQALSEQAIEIFRQVHGHDHPSVAGTLLMLAATFRDEGEYRQAREKYSEALRLSDKLVGRKSDLAAIALLNLAKVEFYLKDYSNAEKDGAEAFSIFRELAGNEHPENIFVQISACWQATTLACEQKYSAAESMLLDQEGRLRSAGQLTTDSELSIAEMLEWMYRLWPKPPAQSEWSAKVRSLLQTKLDQESSLIHQHPEKAGYYLTRGRLYARLGDFADAIHDFQSSRKLYPANYYPWYDEACLLAYNRDDEQYRAHRTAMLKQFAASNDLGQLDAVSKSAMLLGETGVPEAVVTLIGAYDRAIGTTPQNPYYELVKGIAAYRMGQYGQAVDWLSRSEAHVAPDSAECQLTGELYLAAAEHQLRQLDLSRARYQRTLERLQKEVPPIGDDVGGVGSAEDWLILQVALREVQGIIGTTPATSKSPAVRPGT